MSLSFFLHQDLSRSSVKVRYDDRICDSKPGSETGGAAAAVCAMGLAGEIGFAHMQNGDGNATYRNRIIDAIFNMDGDTLDHGAKFEIR